MIEQKNPFFFAGTAICLSSLFLSLIKPLNEEATPLLRLSRLEFQMLAGETYEVPSNLNLYRVSKGYTPKSLTKSYLENCHILGIQPFRFDENSDGIRELNKMQLIWIGAYPYAGYHEATQKFFQSVEKQLEPNLDVKKKFVSLFKSRTGYITNLWEFARHKLQQKKSGIDLKRSADLITAFESYSSRFSDTPYLKKEEWSHPSYLFYQLGFYKERDNTRFETIKLDIKKANPGALDDLEAIISIYDEGANWLLRANLFFLEENWFYDDQTGTFKSMKDFFIPLVRPLLGYIPSIEPAILKLGEVDGTVRGYVPYREYSQFLQPLNKNGEIFLKDTSPARISFFFDSIQEAVPDDSCLLRIEDASLSLLSAFIHSLGAAEKEYKRGVHIYDYGCPVTMMVANIPHELGHFFFDCGRSYWKKSWENGAGFYLQCIDNYILEGMAEIFQAHSIEPILNKFPMLCHDNLLKHYIFSQKFAGNNHSWGFLWMQTFYEILGRDYQRLFLLAGQPGVFLDELAKSPKLQTEEILALSEDTSSVSFQRQKRRKRTPTRLIFPSATLKVDKETFRILNFESFE